MKVPKFIKAKIKECAKYNLKANNLDKEIRDWMEENSIYNDGCLDCFIDCVDTNYNPNVFIKFLEELSDEDELIGNNGY